MRALISRHIQLLMAISILFFSCKKDVEEKTVYDNVVYALDTTHLYSSSAEKDKQKSQTQYISIMHGDLFNSNISSKDLSELSELSLAIGDKTMVNELTLSHYLKNSSVQKPTDSEMRADVEKFVEETYVRFFQRQPGPYEKIYLMDAIKSDPKLTVLEVYTSFILSNEYYYY